MKTRKENVDIIKSDIMYTCPDRLQRNLKIWYQNCYQSMHKPDTMYNMHVDLEDNLW